MLSFLVLIYVISAVCSFPQNHVHEGNFGYDPFGGTFQHIPANLEYVPPVEYPALPPHEEDSDNYVPLVDGKPIYIPETFHDGFVFRDLTYADPHKPLPGVQGDQGHGQHHGVKVGQAKHTKSNPTKKRRHHYKGHIGARNSKHHMHKKPVHKEYDTPVVVQAVSRMKTPSVHKHTYDYETIKKFLDEDHDFSKYLEQHEVPDVTNTGSIAGFTEVKAKPTPEKPVYPVYEKHGSADVDPLTKKEKPTKQISTKKPIQPVYEGYESTKKVKQTTAKPIHKVVEYEQETPIVEAFSHKGKGHNKKPVYEVKDESDSKFTGEPVKKEDSDGSDHDNDYDTPVVIEAFTKKKPRPGKESTVTGEPVKNEDSDHDGDDYDTPEVIEEFTKNKPKPASHEKGKPVHVVKKKEKIPVAVSDEKLQVVSVTSAPVKIVESETKTPSQGQGYADETPIVEAFSKKNKSSHHVKHEHKKPGHDNDGGYDIHVKDKPDHVKITGKSIDDEEYDYDTPEVIEVLTHHKGEKPIKSHHNKDKDEKHTVKPVKPTKHTPVKTTSNDESVEVVATDDSGYEILVKDKSDHHAKITGKSIDDVEYDYDTPEVIEVLTHHKGEKPIKSHHNKDKDEKHTVKPAKPTKHTPIESPSNDEPVKAIATNDKDKYDYEKDKTVSTDKDDVEVEYVWTDEEKNENPTENSKKQTEVITSTPVVTIPTEKDDVEVEYEWTDDDKDYELGDEPLDPRELEVSKVEDEILGKESDEFIDGGSGSVAETPDRPEGRSFLPVDPNVWSLMTNIQNRERHKFKSCSTPKNESGNCMPIQMCAVPNIAATIDELVSNVCVIDEVFIGICCPEFPVETVRVDWDQFVEGNKSDTFNEETSKECGKLPAVDNKTIAWPWMAPLVAASTGKVFCGGALINEQYVLSAAHCTTKIPNNRILVRLGSLDTDKASDEDFAVVEIKRHAQYNPRNMNNDIALLKLSRPVPLGEFRGLICLPEDEDYVGENAILLGFKGFSEKMDDIETLRVISKEDCQHKMGMVVTNSDVCTQPRVEQVKCNDDSGSPLVVGKNKQFKIIGVLTWNRNDCDTRLPSIFTRVSKYNRWIKRHTS